MHFSKTYTELLLALPPELTQSAVQYRQLKKIINQIVAELSSLGMHLLFFSHSPVQLHSQVSLQMFFRPSLTIRPSKMARESARRS